MESRPSGPPKQGELGLEGRIYPIKRLIDVLEINLTEFEVNHPSVKTCKDNAARHYEKCKAILEKNLLPPGTETGRPFEGDHSQEDQKAAAALLEKLKEISKKHGYLEIFKDLSSLTPRNVDANFASAAFFQGEIQRINNYLSSTLSGPAAFEAYKTRETANVTGSQFMSFFSENMFTKHEVTQHPDTKSDISPEVIVAKLNELILLLSKSSPQDERLLEVYKDCKKHLRHNMHVSDSNPAWSKAEDFVEKLENLAKRNGHTMIAADISKLTDRKFRETVFLSEADFDSLIKNLDELLKEQIKDPKLSGSR